jgi:acyl dehydratase
MSHPFDNILTGTRIEGVPFSPTRESIREFCEASLDFNPLHLDDEYMKGSFGKTHFGGIIMHGMNNFGVISKMLTDWLYPIGGVHRRLETRWKSPVKPGDTIRPQAVVTARKETAKSRWITLDVLVLNQRDEVVTQGEAMVEFPVVS